MRTNVKELKASLKALLTNYIILSAGCITRILRVYSFYLSMIDRSINLTYLWRQSYPSPQSHQLADVSDMQETLLQYFCFSLVLILLPGFLLFSFKQPLEHLRLHIFCTLLHHMLKTLLQYFCFALLLILLPGFLLFLFKQPLEHLRSHIF